MIGFGIWFASDRHTVQATADNPTSCTGQRFSDVCPADWFYPYVLDLVNRSAISGYGDNTFRPGNTITRGQIVKVLVISAGLDAALPSSATFSDVPTTNGFFSWVEKAVANGVSSGYACGGPGEPCDAQNRPYFRPNVAVNRGQIAKMIVQAKGWNPPNPSAQTFRDVPASSPYFRFVEYVAAQAVISGYTCGGASEPCPGQYFRPGGSTTRGQARKMISLAVSGAPTPGPQPTTPPTQPPPPGTTPSPLPTTPPQPVPTNGGYWTPPALPCTVLPADNIWNRNIRSQPLHPRSASYISSIGGGSVLHSDFSAGTWQGQYIGIPFDVVPANQPRVPMSFTWPGHSDAGPYPVPGNATIEGGASAGGDRHVIIVEAGTCTAYEMYASYPNGGGSWRAGVGARWSLTSNALRPDGWSSADAAGLPILPGLVRYDEVAAGAINHAIRFTTSHINQSYIWPARHSDGGSTDPNVPPMGLRLRLKASVDISSYPTQLQVILRALQDYGMILADTGDALNIAGTPDPRWNDQMLHQLEGLHASDFEAVDVSGLMIDPNSGQSR
jgi:hypothetical protein